MLEMVIVLTVLWVLGGIAGLVLDGLMWLFWVCLAFLIVTLAFSVSEGVFRGSTKKE